MNVHVRMWLFKKPVDIIIITARSSPLLSLNLRNKSGTVGWLTIARSFIALSFDSISVFASSRFSFLFFPPDQPTELWVNKRISHCSVLQEKRKKKNFRMISYDHDIVYSSRVFKAFTHWMWSRNRERERERKTYRDHGSGVDTGDIQAWGAGFKLRASKKFFLNETKISFL